MANKIWGQPYGYHCFIDGSGCNENLIKSYDIIYEFIQEFLTFYSVVPINATGFPFINKYGQNHNLFSVHLPLMTGIFNMYINASENSIYVDVFYDQIVIFDDLPKMLGKHFGMNTYKMQYLGRQASLNMTGKNEDDILSSILIGDSTDFSNIMSKVTVDGLYLEFGVATGTTLRMIAEAVPDKKVWGFDSFQGLPEDWKEDVGEGHFACDVPTDLPSNTELVVGWFNETLEDWAAKNPGPLAFIHLDADLYSSTDYVMKTLADRFVDGTIIVFDEIYGHPSHKEHEYKNFLEFLDRTGFKWEFIGKRHGESAAFRIYK